MNPEGVSRVSVAGTLRSPWVNVSVRPPADAGQQPRELPRPRGGGVAKAVPTLRVMFSSPPPVPAVRAGTDCMTRLLFAGDRRRIGVRAGRGVDDLHRHTGHTRRGTVSLRPITAIKAGVPFTLPFPRPVPYPQPFAPLSRGAQVEGPGRRGGRPNTYRTALLGGRPPPQLPRRTTNLGFVWRRGGMVRTSTPFYPS